MSKYRLNLDFPASVAGLLERLQDLSDSVSKIEVIRKALKFFDIILTHQDRGGRLILEHKDGSQEVLRIL